MFLDATVEEMLTDIWAHRFKDDPKLLNEISDDDFDVDDVARQLGLEEPEEQDDWEDL